MPEGDFSRDNSSARAGFSEFLGQVSAAVQKIKGVDNGRSVNVSQAGDVLTITAEYPTAARSSSRDKIILSILPGRDPDDVKLMVAIDQAKTCNGSCKPLADENWGHLKTEVCRRKDQAPPAEKLADIESGISWALKAFLGS